MCGVEATADSGPPVLKKAVQHVGNDTVISAVEILSWYALNPDRRMRFERMRSFGRGEVSDSV